MTRRLLLLLRVLCGAGLLVWAFRRVDYSLAASISLSTLDFTWMAAAVGCGGLALLGWALRWHLFLHMHGLNVRLSESIRLTLFADFFNLYFLGPLGADGLRLLMLSLHFAGQKKRITSSILMDHASGLFGGAILYFTFTHSQASWLTANGSLLSSALLRVVDWTLGGLSLFTLLGIFVICVPRLQTFIGQTLGLRLLVRPLEPFYFLKDQQPQMILAQAVSVMTLLSSYAAFWCAGRAAGHDVAVPKFLAIMPVIDVVTGLPISVSGVGVRENLFLELLGKQLGLGAQGALAVSLLGFAAVGVWGLIGGVWLALRRWKTGLQWAGPEPR